VIILFGLWIGLLTGFTEVIVLELRLRVFGSFLRLGRHLVWMVPLVDAILFTLIGLVLALAHRAWPRLVTPARAFGALVFIGVYGVLLLFDQLHPVTTVLLAAGLGVQATRLVHPRLGPIAGFARKSATGLATVLVVLIVGFTLQEHFGERRALARLPAATPGAPNVLLIILDTVRGMSLSLYGYPRPTTPEIERWARSGVAFERAFSEAPWTLPSHASMFTGRHAHELETSWRTALKPGTLTLAEALGRRGYATAGFVANVGYTSRETGLARGFARYEDYRFNAGEALMSAPLTQWLHGKYQRRFNWADLRPEKSAAEIAGRFTGWLDQRDTTRPFFAFLNYVDAHRPYEPPAPFRARFETQLGRPNELAPWKVLARLERAHPEARISPSQAIPAMDLYDGELAYLDFEIGRLLRELEARGLLENTIVVLTADHGEAFGEHGMMNHGNTLYRPLLQVPLVIVYPGHVPAGVRVREPVSLRDLAATIADLSYGGNAEFPGRSLAAHWNGTEAGAAAGPLLAAHVRKLIRQPDWWPASRGEMYSLVQGGFHYIVNQGTGTEELFDLENDITEQHDLAATPAGQRELPNLREALKRLRDAAPPTVH
jgi:arylsulfatase A-like enzyme